MDSPEPSSLSQPAPAESAEPSQSLSSEADMLTRSLNSLGYCIKVKLQVFVRYMYLWGREPAGDGGLEHRTDSMTVSLSLTMVIADVEKNLWWESVMGGTNLRDGMEKLGWMRLGMIGMRVWMVYNGVVGVVG